MTDNFFQRTDQEARAIDARRREANAQTKEQQDRWKVERSALANVASDAVARFLKIMAVHGNLASIAVKRRKPRTALAEWLDPGSGFRVVKSSLRGWYLGHIWVADDDSPAEHIVLLHDGSVWLEHHPPEGGCVTVGWGTGITALDHVPRLTTDLPRRLAMVLAELDLPGLSDAT